MSIEPISTGLIVTYANIATITPEELLDFLHNNYDDVIVCRECALDVSDLASMQGFIGWCQNVMSFLMPLMAKMDIVTRGLKADKTPGSDYQNAQSKKYILGLYYDHLERVYKTISRQCSLFNTQYVNEYAMDRRSDNVVKQPDLADEPYFGE